MQARSGMDSPTISEITDEFRNVVRGSWQYRWQAIVLAWFLSVSTWIFVLSMPDVYEAKTRLYIDTRSSLRPLLKGLAVDSDMLADVKVMVNSIKSRPNLLQIAIQSGLYLETGSIPDLEADNKLAGVLRHLDENIDMTLSKNQMLEISFSEANKGVVLSVVNNVLSMFVEGLLGTNRNDTESAQEFIEEKLQEYEILLAEAEERLANFKKRNIGQMPGEEGGYYVRLQAAMSKLVSMDLKVQLLQERRDGLKRQMAGEEPVFGILSSSGGQQLTATSPEIRRLESELTALRLQYTDSYPDIVRIQSLLESLRAELQQQNTGVASSAATPLDMNPVYQEIKIQFNEAELELAQLRTERTDQTRLVNALKQKIDTIPEIEAELKRLNRSYDTNKAQYDALLQRLERARLSEDAEKSRTAIKFRVIDPPIVSPAPVGPNRVLLMSIGLLIGIGAGIALALLRSILDPVFFTAQRLERHFGVPVIGVIGRWQSSQELTGQRINFFIFSCFVSALILCFGTILTFNQASVQVVARITDLFG